MKTIWMAIMMTTILAGTGLAQYYPVFSMNQQKIDNLLFLTPLNTTLTITVNNTLQGNLPAMNVTNGTFRTGNWTFDTGSWVGIGTIPTTTFEVKGSASNFKIQGTGIASMQGAIIGGGGISDAGVLQVNSLSDSYIMGDTGIGVKTPNTTLHVAGTVLAQGGNFTGTGATPDAVTDAGYIMPFGKYLYAYNTNNVSLRKIIGMSVGNSPELTVGQDVTALITMMNFIAGNAGSFKFIVNSSTKMFINGTTGNVGVGTTTPYSTLSIGGATGLDINPANSNTPPNQTRPYMRIGGASSQNLNINGANSTSGVVALNADTAGNVWLATGGGNVGVGTTSPQTFLHVNGAETANYGQLAIQGTANNELLSFINNTNGRSAYVRVTGSDLVISNDQAGNMRFLVNSQSEKARFDSAGDFGIGTTNPNQKLEVVGTIRINGTDVIDIAPGIAGSFDRVDWKAVRDNLGISFQLNPNGNNTMAKITLANNASSTSFGSMFLGVNANTGFLTPQTVGGSNLTVDNLVIGATGGGGLGGSNWANITVYGNTSVNGNLQTYNSGTKKSFLTVGSNNGGSTMESQINFLRGGAGRPAYIVYANSNDTWKSGDWAVGLDWANSNQNQFVFKSNNNGTDTPVMSLMPNGNVGIGVTNPTSKLSIYGGTTQLQMIGTDDSYPATSTITNSNTSWNGAYEIVYRANGTQAAQVQAGTNSVQKVWDMWAYNGTANIRTGQFQAQVVSWTNQSVNNSDRTASTRWYWCSVNSTGSNICPVTVDSNGLDVVLGSLGVNTSSANAAFQVVGNANITGNLYVTGCLKVNGTTYGTCI